MNPPRKRPPLPLSSFDPRFRELLLRGAREAFLLPCTDSREATALRHRVQEYRSQCKKQREAAEWEPLYQCIIRIVIDDNGNTCLLFQPRSQEFDHLLSGLPIEQKPTASIETRSILDQMEAEQKEEKQ